MATSKPDIIAHLRLYSVQEGGRKSITPPEIFRCVFEFEGQAFDCALLLNEVGPLAPGQEYTVPIAFLFPNYVKHQLATGSRFRLWEGRYVGEGEVGRVIG
jgi:hypothetical protein